MQDHLWYLSGPYSRWPAGINDACATAARIAGTLLKRGIPVFSPICHSHVIALASDIDPYDHSIWLKSDHWFVEVCGGLIVADLPGWRESYGVQEEIKWFKLSGKPIVLLNSTTWDMEPLPEVTL